ncbi:LysR family transcriptional regulator [Cereibacter sp. SYSU M97828]|nr:LysR family transcriptional regulator [Cereibacter flavus]
MPNTLPLDDLNIFLAVVRAGGFRGAARNLGLSPATVSDTIARLEAGLDVRLLTRTTRSVTPTDAGRDLAARIAPLLAETTAALDGIRSRSGDLRGHLKLNVPGAVMVDILPPLVERFLALHPGVTMEIMVDDRVPDHPLPEEDIHLVYPRHRHPSAIVRTYLDFCLARVPELEAAASLTG